MLRQEGVRSSEGEEVGVFSLFLCSVGDSLISLAYFAISLPPFLNFVIFGVAHSNTSPGVAELSCDSTLSDSRTIGNFKKYCYLFILEGESAYSYVLVKSTLMIGVKLSC